MPIVQFDLEASPPWFTMPLASQSFEQKIAADRPNGIIDTEAWQDILAAVEELHRLGYVHRDLKPANVLLLGSKWVLADFGLILPIARDTTILTSSQSAYGSHFYAAPEQASDFRNTPEQAGATSSLWAAYYTTRLTGLLLSAIRADPRARRLRSYSGEVHGIAAEAKVPTITALRSALFDLWRTSQFEAPAPVDADILAAVLTDPASTDAWRRLIAHAEALPSTERGAVMGSLNAELLVQLNSLDDVLFSRIMTLISEWAAGTAFEWIYCDVVGDRLLEAYRVGPVRVRCQIVLAALELAVSHNRWHVMNQVGAMLGQAADNGLVDRLLIELGLDPTIEPKLRRIEEIVHWARDRWHAKIADHLNQQDNARASAVTGPATTPQRPVDTP